MECGMERYKLKPIEVVNYSKMMASLEAKRKAFGGK
jgi:hypothetical protein